MRTTKQIESAIAKLPLAEREALASSIERSISEEYTRLAEASVATDIQKMERILATRGFTVDQMDELQSRMDAADRGDAHFVPWSQVREEILAEFRRDQ